MRGTKNRSILSSLLRFSVPSFTTISCEFDDKNENQIKYFTPKPGPEGVYLYESFDDRGDFNRNWLKSKGKRDGTNYRGQWDLVKTDEKLEDDFGLRMRTKMAHHAISRRIFEKFTFNGSDLIVQYSVQFKSGQDCGGAYLKLLSSPSGNLSLVDNETPYSVMFGPDKCGNDYRLHFIFMHRNEKNVAREIHWTRGHQVKNLIDAIGDKKWHLFRLHLKPDNTFELFLDGRSVGTGDLHGDFYPSVNPPKEINDPDNLKPDDWDDRPKIPDPEAVKPFDWDEDEPRMIIDEEAVKPENWLDDEPAEIPDPNAVKPDDWDDENDGFWEPQMIKNPECHVGCGEWKPPVINNPKYKGPWKSPLIRNPDYKGEWKPKKIPNPDYYEDPNPYKMTPIDAVAFELWSLSDNIVFDDILITDSVEIADAIVIQSYQIKRDLNDETYDHWIVNLIKKTNKKPWLWLVYALAISIPLVLFIGYCCVSPLASERNRKKAALEVAAQNETCTLETAKISEKIDNGQKNSTQIDGVEKEEIKTTKKDEKKSNKKSEIETTKKCVKHRNLIHMLKKIRLKMAPCITYCI